MYKVKRGNGQVKVVNDTPTDLYVFDENSWIVWKKSEGVTTVAQAAVVKNLSDEDLLKALATVVKLG
jgi:hypothetical protein